MCILVRHLQFWLDAAEGQLAKPGDVLDGVPYHLLADPLDCKRVMDAEWPILHPKVTCREKFHACD